MKKHTFGGWSFPLIQFNPQTPETLTTCVVTYSLRMRPRVWAMFGLKKKKRKNLNLKEN